MVTLSSGLLQWIVVTTWRATVNIDRIHVKGLFDDFDHDLAFDSSERIMLVIGPNGSGKTTILKIINALFNQPINRLASIPFREVDVSFDDETRLIVKRDTVSRHHGGDRLPLTLTCHRGGVTETIDPSKISIDRKDLGFLISFIERSIPVLERVGSRKWHHLGTGSILDLTDVITDFWDELPRELQRIVFPTPDWLQDIQHSVVVRLINTERLTRVSRRRWHDCTITPKRTVSHYSQQLARHIQDSIAKYGALSQLRDRTFPARLVDAFREQSNGSVEKLREDLDAIEKKCLQLEDAGLLAGEQLDLKISDLDQVDESQLSVLAVYAEDAKEKLAVFDELYQKVSTFKRIVNSRFSHKQVAVSEKGLRVAKDDGTNLDLEKLSSGEQHELVMLYELLFRTSSNSLILIDQPEISLHVSWQEQWLKDLEETAELSGFRVIVATHSPEIIGDRWHLTTRLRSRNEG